MNTTPNRIVIYPKDVSRITGMQPDTARKLLSRIRKKFKKKKRALISIAEFCQYMGFREEWVSPFL